MTDQEMNDLLESADNIPVLTSNADIRNLLISSTDANDMVIAINDYIGNLCEWGENLEKLTEPQKNFFLNQVFEIEVNNGGISQYFFNSSGQHAHETVESLKVIGAMKIAEILQNAIAIFPKASVPKDDDKRESVLEKMEKKGDEIWEKLEEKFYEYPDNLNELNLAYVRKNIDQF